MQPITIKGNLVTMTMWLPQLRREKALYLEIADAVCQDLERGVLKPGDRLPPQRDLAYRLGVTTGTVTRAYAEIGKQGLLSGEVGRGSYLRAPAARAVPLAIPPADAATPIDLAQASPPQVHAVQDFDSALRQIMSEPGRLSLLDYAPANGHPLHRAMGATWLARSGISVPDQDVVITAGAHAGLFACLSATTQPGDHILVEALGYTGFRPITRTLGVTPVPVAVDEKGLIPEALERAARDGGSRLLYIVPTLHNPTTVTLPHDRRTAIVDIARRYGLIIIEDDIFRLLDPRVQAPTLYSLAPERTYHVTSLSKTLSPGLRVGIVAAPPGRADTVNRHMLMFGGRAVGLATEVARLWIEGGTADRILAAIISENAVRRELALGILDPRAVRCQPGACFLWLRLPETWTPGDFARELADRGVKVTPGPAFAVGPRADDRCVRVCFGGASREAFQQALHMVNGLLDEDPSERFNHVA